LVYLIGFEVAVEVLNQQIREGKGGKSFSSHLHFIFISSLYPHFSSSPPLSLFIFKQEKPTNSACGCGTLLNFKNNETSRSAFSDVSVLASYNL